MAHFYDRVPEEIRRLSNQQAVEAYAQRATIPGKAIEGLTKDQLVCFPVPGTWSIQQIVVHLMDTDLVAAYRMKRIIAEDRPKLDCYDETAFAEKLHYNKLDATAASEIFRLNRQQTATMLRLIPDDAFARIAQHPEIGDLPLGQLLRLYCYHVDHHMKFLHDKAKLVRAM